MFHTNHGTKALAAMLVLVGVIGFAVVGEAKASQTLVPAGSDWKYIDPPYDLHSVGWPGVDDSGWQQGAAPLGFGDPHIVTALTIASPRYPCHYFRHHFIVEDPSGYLDLTIRVLRDDGCIVYLNGTEVVRSNMPAGAVEYSTLSSGTVGGADETTYWQFSVSPALLVAGENILSAEAHQCNSTSSDLGFDLELTGTLPDPHQPHQPALIRPADGATGVSTSPVLEVTVSDPDGAEVLDVDFFGRQIPSGGEEFTIVALPDTQKYVFDTGNPDIFTSQTQWIADNAAANNIVMVVHEGDITETYSGLDVEWVRANTSMSVLDGVVPYAVLPGNHDELTYFNQYFPYTRYESEPWYGGHYPAAGNQNNFCLISAGGVDFIIISLGYNPSGEAITWADGVLKANPDRVGIIVTHSYMDGSGNRTSEGGTAIWDGLVLTNDNVHFVLCGHASSEYARTDTVNGREVHQLLADYQNRANGGDGWLRVMRFVPAEDTVYVQTYSPWLGEYETDGNSQFTLSLPMGSYSLIGTVADVANGGSASVVWSELATETVHEWFVEVTDPTDRTTVGPVWSFTTGLTTQASNPNPADGAGQVASDVVLSWTAGMSAAWHDVYFGEDQAGVAGADISTQGIYQGRQDLGSETFAPAGLVGNQTYYWRIDEVEADGTTIHTGAVWSFTTLNEAPVAVDDPYYIVDEDGLLVVDALAEGVLANDTDAEGQPLTAILQTDVAGGTLSLNPDGTFTYAPDADFHGTDTFTYKASDGTSQSASAATVTVTVNPINDAPTAGDDAYNMTQDTVLSVPAPGVLGNDNDVDGDAIVAVLVADVLHGSLVLNQDGSFSYSPSQGYVGQDTFQYEAGDGLLASNVATVTITISEVDDPPTAADDQYSMDQDTVLSVPAPGVLDNDTDPENGPLTAILAGDVSSGTLVLNDDGSFTYTPNAGYYGIDGFTYTANDGTSSSNEATVTITVNQVIDYDAYVVQDPTVTYGVLTGGIEGASEAGDGLVQEIAEAPNGTAGMASLQAEYVLNTPAAPGEVTELTLYLGASWTGYDADDPLVVSIFDGGSWQDITADIADGSFTPAAYPGDYIDAEGNIRVRFTDTAPVRKEKKDILTIDLLFAHVAAEPVEGHDVAVTAIDAPGSVLSGEQVTVDVTVENQGTFDETFDVELTDGGSPIDSRTVSLAPGASTVVGFTWDTTAASLGDHTLTATAGPVAEETNTTDNSMSKVVTVQGPITDIAVTTVSVPANVVQGSIVEVQVTVANVGNQDVGSVITVSLADTPDAGGSAGAVSGPQTVAGLNAGASATLTFIWDTTAASPGAHTVSASHDFADDNAANDSASEISTVTQAGSTMHVESIEMSLVPTGKNTKGAAAILIHDNGETPLAGATVTGDWYFKGSLIQTAATGITDGTGSVVITSVPEKAKSGDTFTFRVTDVALSGYSYEPGGNVETEDSIAVP
ncbi:MAG: tandem-95 repeat protein [Phycisphaerales bacterium]|nr:MAG: tandem-95 repeat protein [Phycisphaerales bacterium]